MDTSEYAPIPLAEAIEEVVARLKGDNPDSERVARITDRVIAASQTDISRPTGLTDDERQALDLIRERLEDESAGQEGQ